MAYSFLIPIISATAGDNEDGSLIGETLESDFGGTFTDVNRKDVGNVRNISIKTTIGQLNGTYYFVVTAYNVAKIESEFSNEVSDTFSKVPRTATNTEIQ